MIFRHLANIFSLVAHCVFLSALFLINFLVSLKDKARIEQLKLKEFKMDWNVENFRKKFWKLSSCLNLNYSWIIFYLFRTKGIVDNKRICCTEICNIGRIGYTSPNEIKSSSTISRRGWRWMNTVSEKTIIYFK